MYNFKIKHAIIGAAILVLAFFLILFGITGIRTVVGIFLLFMLPIYMIINNFDFDMGEKVIFSFFIGIGLFSTLTYWLGFVVGSLKLSALIIFILLSALGVILRFMGFPRNKSKQNEPK
jgi:apolipoprotein N-acyltransferase